MSNYPRIDRPTEPGWYWHRDTDRWRVVEVLLRTNGILVIETSDSPTAPWLAVGAGDWRGPIHEPKE